VSREISRPQAIRELEHTQQHGQDPEKVRQEVPSQRRKVLRYVRRGIEDAGIFHMRDEIPLATEYHEEHKFGSRTRSPNGRDRSGH
jgi:hypothetical protein